MYEKLLCVVVCEKWAEKNFCKKTFQNTEKCVMLSMCKCISI